MVNGSSKKTSNFFKPLANTQSKPYLAKNTSFMRTRFYLETFAIILVGTAITGCQTPAKPPHKTFSSPYETAPDEVQKEPQVPPYQGGVNINRFVDSDPTVQKKPPVKNANALMNEVEKVAIPEPNKPGFVRSPYSPEAGLISVEGLPPGVRVKDPYTKRIMIVPPTPEPPPVSHQEAPAAADVGQKANPISNLQKDESPKLNHLDVPIAQPFMPTIKQP